MNSIPLADTSDMVRLHRVFRNALSDGPALVGTVADGDLERAEVVGSYYANVLSLLSGHHTGEDELVTPKLLERLPDQADLVSRIAGQHEDVLGGIDDLQKAVADWQSDAGAESRAKVLRCITELEEGLIPHLDEEEREILPIAATCINAAEWGELPGHGMRTFAGDKLWLILGLVQEQMTPEQKEMMEANMPPPLLEFWTTTGRGLFASYVAQLRS